MNKLSFTERPCQNRPPHIAVFAKILDLGMKSLGKTKNNLGRKVSSNLFCDGHLNPFVDAGDHPLTVFLSHRRKRQDVAGLHVED